MKRTINQVIALFFTIISFLLITSVWAAEISIPAIKAKAGEQIQLPIMVDNVENLAGVKLVLKYDPKILTYKTGQKTKYTEALMHVVNDKKQGQLIIVMAGARGIKGENIPLFNLTFEINKDIKKPTQTLVEITEVQLMSDKLKNISYTIKVGPIEISGK